MRRRVADDALLFTDTDTSDEEGGGSGCDVLNLSIDLFTFVSGVILIPLVHFSQRRKTASGKYLRIAFISKAENGKEGSQTASIRRHGSRSLRRA
jgi:hypothetical protein